MAINEIWRSTANASGEEDLTVLDYDTVVQCVGITLTNGTAGTPADGHGTLILAAPTPTNIIASVDSDQFDDGQRHILAALVLRAWTFRARRCLPPRSLPQLLLGSSR
jgi:hypothetical protein